MRLADYLNLHGLTKAEFARRIGRDKNSVGRFVSGEHIPRRETMLRIVSETDGAVQPNDFYLEHAVAE